MTIPYRVHDSVYVSINECLTPLIYYTNHLSWRAVLLVEEIERYLYYTKATYNQI
jgi:hypothetical protein